MLLEAAAEAWNSVCSAKTRTFFFTTSAPDNRWQSAPPNSSLCVRGRTTGPCSKMTLFFWNLGAAELLAWNCPVLSCSSLWKSCSVACSLAAHLRHLGKQRLMLLSFPSRLEYPRCAIQLSHWGPMGSFREHPKAVLYLSPRPTSAEQVNFWKPG